MNAIIIPQKILAKYSPCVQACALAGLVKLPDPIPDTPVLLKRGVVTPILRGNGKPWRERPEIAAAVQTLLDLPVVQRGMIARVAFRHRAPYQAVRKEYNNELERRERVAATREVFK